MGCGGHAAPKVVDSCKSQRTSGFSKKNLCSKVWCHLLTVRHRLIVSAKVRTALVKTFLSFKNLSAVLSGRHGFELQKVIRQ